MSLVQSIKIYVVKSNPFTDRSIRHLINNSEKRRTLDNITCIIGDWTRPCSDRQFATDSHVQSTYRFSTDR